MPHEMDVHIENGTFRLAFVGMSNCGKTYRSRVLHRDKDFYWHHVDGEIQHQLGFPDMDSISDWLSFPSSPTYKEREAQYLAAEKAATSVGHIDTKGKNLVFDTTGSVLYLEQDILTWLRNECLIVYLEVLPERVESMINKFFEEPKPLIWADAWEKEGDESDEATMRRCYPMLLDSRRAGYEKLGHLKIPFEEIKDTTADETLAIIRSHLGSRPK